MRLGCHYHIQDLRGHGHTVGDIEVSSVMWGLLLGITLYLFFTAGKQTF